MFQQNLKRLILLKLLIYCVGAKKTAENPPTTLVPIESNSTIAELHDEPCSRCTKLYTGILHRVSDPENFAKGCLVHGVLHCHTFDLFRGKDLVNSLNVATIVTPILLTPGTHLCFTIHDAGNPQPEILCSENLNCRDEWWKALTRAILCSHRGGIMRHEIAGEPLLEEEEEMLVEKVVDKPEKGGINVKISGVDEMPIVKMKKQSSLSL